MSKLWSSLLIVKEELIIEITLYTTNCKQCKILKDKLDEKGIEYLICDDMDTMLSQGIKSAPMLRIGEEIMDYNKAIKWVLSHD